MHLLMFNTENFRHVKPGFMQPSVGACLEGRTEHIYLEKGKRKTNLNRDDVTIFLTMTDN